MKNLKKALRIMSIICLIFLASVGVGLSGAAPILPKNRSLFIDTTPKTELVEVKKVTPNSTAEFKN